ncbi:MAG: hypothetical protein ABJI60_20450 [Kangiellaceae bacterium]|jgi:hypothetical protein
MLNIIVLFLLKLFNLLGLTNHKISYKLNPSDNTDLDNKTLQQAADKAVAVWNKYVSPKTNIEFELSAINIFENTAARAFQPDGPSCESVDNSWHVEVNVAFMDRYSKLEDRGVNIIASFIMHEIAHIYGFGSPLWKSLFDHNGVIRERYAQKYPVLKGKKISHDGDHWDHHGTLLSEHVDEDGHFAPETIVVMALLGHRVKVKPDNHIEFEHFLSEANSHSA